MAVLQGFCTPVEEGMDCVDWLLSPTCKSQRWSTFVATHQQETNDAIFTVDSQCGQSWLSVEIFEADLERLAHLEMLCLPVMKRILLMIFLAAAAVYGILLWKTNVYLLPPTAIRRKTGLEMCKLEPPFASLLKRCVVVGNGGVLRNKTLGEKIDSYDVVIRMNNGPVIGYEEDVGRRTTFRLFYPESIFSDPINYDPNTTVILLVFKPHDLKWLWNILSGHKIKPKHPTTGLIAITMAFHICSEVHLAGFKYNFTDRNSSLHYYGNETMSEMIENGYHNIIAEQTFLKSLIDKNFVISLT
ncbi:Type 2 lactosamine alpha-2,3-sialyltransferase [Chelonia mydas]|uniref:Type 2 lactosamine alpha-2,3-sialyltransferase n=1 Tax=Chelonia mydas TaxID=8469 RepID=M7BAB3_CHEMY|nr:Type 2 lactosamine alpha-2,3-sialyltransferase [Chelonia mydas]